MVGGCQGLGKPLRFAQGDEAVSCTDRRHGRRHHFEKSFSCHEPKFEKLERRSQTTGQRAGSAHIVEKLCSFFLLDIQKHSWRASGQEGPRGIGSGCEAHSARTQHTTTCIKQGYINPARRSRNPKGMANKGMSAAPPAPTPAPVVGRRLTKRSCEDGVTSGKMTPDRNPVFSELLIIFFSQFFTTLLPGSARHLNEPKS